jgi:hypothetical protein
MEMDGNQKRFSHGNTTFQSWEHAGRALQVRIPIIYFSTLHITTGILIGGHHFRAWKQNGTQADSGAWFIGYEIVFNEKYFSNIRD